MGRQKVYDLDVRPDLLWDLKMGKKTLEVRLRTRAFDGFEVGHEIRFNRQVFKRIAARRHYGNFLEMLDNEKHSKIAPGRSREEVLNGLFRIYQDKDMELGVIVFELGESDDAQP